MGVYGVKGIDYTKIKDMSNISFIMYNFKKYNDPKGVSPLSDVDYYGTKKTNGWNNEKVAESFIYKTIAEGYKSKEFYISISRMFMPNSNSTISVFYKEPILFMYIMRTGHRAECTNGYKYCRGRNYLVHMDGSKIYIDPTKIDL